MALDITKIPELISVLGDAYSFAVTKEPKVVSRLSKRKTRVTRKVISSKHVLALVEIIKYLLEEIEACVMGNPALAGDVVIGLIETYDVVATVYSSVFVAEKEFITEPLEGSDADDVIGEVDSSKIRFRLEGEEEDEQEEAPI